MKSKEWLDHFWEKDLSECPWYKALFIRFLRIQYRVIRDAMEGHLSLQAMSLVYTTLITLVPLLALSFSVLKSLGAHNQIEPLLLNLLQPLGQDGVEIATKIIEFVDNIKVGVLGAIGLGLLFYSVIALMQKIERAFNDIWRVKKSRTMGKRFSDYLSALLIGPVLIFLSAGITASVRDFGIIEQLGLSDVLDYAIEIASIVLPYLLMTFAFTFIYIFMPNTKVNFLPALCGGAFAALMWKIMGFLFTALIAGSANYVAIYAAFATLIVFMIWCYLAWLVVLVGADIAFYIQNPQFTRTGRQHLSISNRIREDGCLAILYHLGRDHYGQRIGKTPEQLSVSTKMPITIIYELLATLRNVGFVQIIDDAVNAYMSVIPYEDFTVKQVLDAVRADGEAFDRYQDFNFAKAVKQNRIKIDTVLDKNFKSTLMKDLLDL